MKRLIGRLLGVFFVLAGIAVAWLYYQLQSSLPQLDGSIPVVGLTASAAIQRDAQGLVTITAENRADAAYATGFAHGQDRYFQMDLTRRNAAGELAELFGVIAIDRDRQNRFHRFRSRARSLLTALGARETEILDAYTAGVNAGLDSLDARPFEYLLLGEKPSPWRAEDSMLVAYAMFLVLNDERATSDIRRGIAMRTLPSDVYDWMYPDGTSWDAPMMGEARVAKPVPSSEVFDISVRAMRAELLAGAADLHPAPRIPGSNNWAVSGRLTASGRAIVSNDMHLEITVPNIFYRARIIVEGATDASGLTLPGTPLIVAGSNGRVAWGFTNSYGDWSDAVELQILPNGRYATPAGPADFDTITEIIRVKDADDVEMRIRETVWGPVLPEDSNPYGPTAVAWTAHAPNALNLNHLALESAENVSQALAIANTLGMPPQNFVCGDAEGNIGWTLTGIIPVREGYDPWLPADWSNGSGWQGWLPPEHYPRVENPESGRIWTANARVADGEALRLIGDGGYDLGARQRQIRDGLFSRDSFSPRDMLEIQGDHRAIFLQRWRDMLLTVLREADLRDHDEYRALLAEWDPSASVSSVGYRLIREFRLEVRALAFEMLMLPVRDAHGEDQPMRISNQFESALWQMVTQRPKHLLTSDFDSWEDLMMTVVDRQIGNLTSEHADGLEGRTWGERNTAAVRHPLSRAVPQLSAWLDMPAEPLSGDSNMPKALGPSFGASERFGVSPGDEANAYLHMPAGQSGHPLSPFYRAGHDDWVRVRPSPFLPGEAQYELTLIAR